jgi:hypothetical protein
MSRVLQASGFAASCLAIFVMLGGHWAVLQSVAWMRMASVLLRQDRLGTTLVKTFDGKHPCALCLKIREGRQQESQQQKPPCLAVEKSPALFCDARQVAAPLPPTSAATAPFFWDSFCTDFSDSPPTPPPRRI